MIPNASVSGLPPTLAVCADVSKWEDVTGLADRAFDTFGVVHVLCNIAGSRIRAGGIWQRTLEDWQWVLGEKLWVEAERGR